MSRLRCHPFPVVARFERVVAVSFAFEANVLEPLVPGGLVLDDYNGLGFVTVAMVWTKALRPAAFPEALGQDFFLAGYRVFTRMRDESGRRLRGLKILRSETDRQRMVTLGNLTTGYRYRLVSTILREEDSGWSVKTIRPDGMTSLDLTLETGDGLPLPEGSPFPDWRTARRFAGPMPFTFSERSDGKFVVVEGSRDSWEPRPVRVVDWKVSIFDEEPFRGHRPVLANAFMVEDIDYRWEKGRVIRPQRDP